VVWPGWLDGVVVANVDELLEVSDEIGPRHE
jgi:hypothetical protein